MPKYNVNDMFRINNTTATVTQATETGYYALKKDGDSTPYSATEYTLRELIRFGAEYVPALDADDLQIGTVIHIGSGSYTKCDPGMWLETTINLDDEDGYEFEHTPYTNGEMNRLLLAFEYRVIYDPTKF